MEERELQSLPVLLLLVDFQTGTEQGPLWNLRNPLLEAMEKATEALGRSHRKEEYRSNPSGTANAGGESIHSTRIVKYLLYVKKHYAWGWWM